MGPVMRFRFWLSGRLIALAYRIEPPVMMYFSPGVGCGLGKISEDDSELDFVVMDEVQARHNARFRAATEGFSLTDFLEK